MKDPKKKKLEPPPGYRVVFRRYFVHPKTGQRIYPKSGKCFPFIVPE